jgi:voltage-gated potassium channel
VVLPTAIGANKVAQLIVHPTAENMLEQILSQSNLIGDLGQIGLRFDEMEVQEDSPLVNRAIEEIEIRSNHGFLIVGIRRADGTNRIHPDPLTKLLPHDVVVVLGHNDDIPELASRFKASSRMTYRGVTFEN